MGLKLTTPPASEPLSLTDVKRHLRVVETDDTEDNYISDLMIAARETCEIASGGRAFLTQTWQLTIDAFPDTLGLVRRYATQQFPPNSYSLESFLIRGLSDIGGPIYLPRPPLQSVASLKYIDTNGVLQTLDPALYVVDTNGEPGRIVPAYNTFWPSTRPIANAVQINFIAGYGAAPASVPRRMMTAMKFLVAHWYEHREAAGESSLKEVPMGVESLIWSERQIEAV